ncbi:MAG: TolC family protein [Nitrospinaceae bacterium]
MKPLIFLMTFIWVASPGITAGTEDDDYKKMISEFEEFRPSYPPPGAKKDIEVMKEERKPSPSGMEMKKLQERWNRLTRGIFQRGSFYALNPAEEKELEPMRENVEIAVNYLETHPGLDSMIKVALTRNLNLQSVRKKLEAKMESYSQVVQLEDILSQFSSFVKELDTQVSAKPSPTSLKGYYPFPGALSLKANISEQEVRIVKAKYEIALRDMVTRIQERFFEWNFFARAIGITQEHVKLLKELESVASVHFRTGKGGFNDVIKAQIKRLKLEDDLINLKEEKKVAEAEIGWLLNLPSDHSFSPGPAPLRPVTLPVSDLADLAFQHQQELKLLSEEIKKSQLAIELAEKKYYPDLTPGFSYMKEGRMNREEPVKDRNNFPQTPDTRPIYWFGENDAYIREARLNYQALLKKLEDHKERLRFKVEQFSFELEKAVRAVRLYEGSLLPLAQKALAVSIAEYKTGKTDFLSLLDAETTLLNFGIDYQRALKQHGQNKARLEQLLGKRLAEIEVNHESANG